MRTWFRKLLRRIGRAIIQDEPDDVYAHEVYRRGKRMRDGFIGPETPIECDESHEDFKIAQRPRRPS